MTNPNPMHSRCGLEDCDCEYTIGRLLKDLERVEIAACGIVGGSMVPDSEAPYALITCAAIAKSRELCLK